MPQHRATCARRYWRRIEQHASLDDSIGLEQSKSRLYFSPLSPPNEKEEGNLHFRNVEPSEAPDKIQNLRIVHENTFDARLAADALSESLLWFEGTGNVEAYKTALVTTLRLNITINNLERPVKKLDCFIPLFWLASHIDQLARGDQQINDLDDDSETILHVACLAGAAELLEPLFWRGACFNAISDFNETPLDLAIKCGDMDTVRFALALGSDPNLNYPLCHAWDLGRHDIMTLLVEYGADINQTWYDDDIPLLSTAIRRGDLAAFRLALSLGANPNVSRPMGDLIDECLERKCNDCVHEEMAISLIEHGADVSGQFSGGRTIFHYAVLREHTQLLRSALDRISSPAILDVKDEYDCTALHYATDGRRSVSLDRTPDLSFDAARRRSRYQCAKCNGRISINARCSQWK
jgi:ankyrin repeat protein